MSIFSYVSGPSVCPPWRSVCSENLPIYSLDCLSSQSGVLWVFIYFGDQTLLQCIICRYIFPYGWFSLDFNTVFYSHAEAVKSDEIPYVHTFLYVPCSRGHIDENICLECLRSYCLCSPLGLLCCCDLYLSLLSIWNFLLCMV